MHQLYRGDLKDLNVADVGCFLAATASASDVGPGIYYCLQNQQAQASATATATWAQNHGFNF